MNVHEWEAGEQMSSIHYIFCNKLKKSSIVLANSEFVILFSNFIFFNEDLYSNAVRITSYIHVMSLRLLLLIILFSWFLTAVMNLSHQGPPAPECSLL